MDYNPIFTLFNYYFLKMRLCNYLLIIDSQYGKVEHQVLISN